jgi:hypothetical protein
VVAKLLEGRSGIAENHVVERTLWLAQLMALGTVLERFDRTRTNDRNARQKEAQRFSTELAKFITEQTRSAEALAFAADHDITLKELGKDTILPRKGTIRMAGSLLAEPYPDEHKWKRLVEEFAPDAIAHKLLLAHVPYVFRDEPLKFALFRKTIADAFDVEPSNVFIVGSAMAGRSLKGSQITKIYSSKSDIDTLIISEHLFTTYVMQSLSWVKEITKPDFTHKPPKAPPIPAENARYVGMLADNAEKGIWRPDSLPRNVEARIDFFRRFSDVSLKTLGLQLSDDTVAKVNGRIARSFEDAVQNLASSISRLRREFRGEASEQTVDPILDPDTDVAEAIVS